MRKIFKEPATMAYLGTVVGTVVTGGAGLTYLGIKELNNPTPELQLSDKLN